MYPVCVQFLQDLAEVVNHTNYSLAVEMFGLDDGVDSDYDTICVRSDITYQDYFTNLQNRVQRVVDNFYQKTDCRSSLYLVASLASQIPKTAASISNYFSNNFRSDTGIDLEKIVLDTMAERISHPKKHTGFRLYPEVKQSLESFTNFFVTKCRCHIIELFKWSVDQYGLRYSSKFQNRSQQEIVNQLRRDYKRFLDYFRHNEKISQDITPDGSRNFLRAFAEKLTQISGLSIETELQRLIPDEIGALKNFFIKIITRYYENIHPIIWAQIFRGMVNQALQEMPMNREEFFAFATRQIALNSGPFILKILQLTHPILPSPIAKKYGIQNLSYPKLDIPTVKRILRKVLISRSANYQLLANFSASVGHVCKIRDVRHPHAAAFIIKIIKPLAIAQSCWEYQTLSDLFPKNTCEHAFIDSMLRSTGLELDLRSEMKNITLAHGYYTTDYQSVYKIALPAKLTTVENIDGVLHPKAWYAMAITLAPGSSLKDLKRQNILRPNTRFAHKLYRCLDLLVYKFFNTLIRYGFYHGDLHEGNIFFSAQNWQITLIDFGAVGNIEIFRNTDDSRLILEILIMQSFFNYDEMFHLLTQNLNTKCEGQIDTQSQDYIDMLQNLRYHRYRNLELQKQDRQASQDYINNLNSQHQLDLELGMQSGGGQYSIYDYMETVPQDEMESEASSEIQQQDRAINSADTHLQTKSKTTSFGKILEMIIKFYATHGINIAIKFNELYQLQKAYALLLGTLESTSYNSYRVSHAMKRAFSIPENLGNLIRNLDMAHFAYHTRKYYNKIYHQDIKAIEAGDIRSSQFSPSTGDNDKYREKITAIDTARIDSTSVQSPNFHYGCNANANKR